MAQQEPPELKDRDGEKIVIFRSPDGSFFSNHPDYPMALALHEQSKATADVEEDEEPDPDNGDGVVEYNEMTSKDLVALTKERGMSLPSSTKRSQVIEALQAWDAEQAGAK